MRKNRKILNWLGRILGVILSAAALTALYFALVIAQPQGEEKTAETAQPVWTGAPLQRADQESELLQMIRDFPAPALDVMSGSGMVFVSATSEDVTWTGGLARVLTLYWQTQEGEPLILQSIFPAEALDCMGKGDYVFSDTAGPTLSGRASVRMENEKTIRVHVQVKDVGLYVMTVPKSLAASLSFLSRSVQLVTAD